MEDVTPTQGRYLAYIHAYTTGFGLPPAESEIADAIGVSPPSANQMMKMLERKGFIRRKPGVPRSIEILIAPNAIPKWKGKRISRTVWEWRLPSSETHHPGPTSTSPATVYRFKIVLLDSDPEIWRRIETHDVELRQLHAQIQTAMGWRNSHLHQFEIADSRYSDLRFMLHDVDDFGAIDYSGLRVSDLVAKHGAKLRMGYEYDFGDSWEHIIVVEKVLPFDAAQTLPLCIKGKRAGPPDDVGGIWGYYFFLEALADPNHPDHEMYSEWVDEEFDPEAFDMVAINAKLRRLK